MIGDCIYRALKARPIPYYLHLLSLCDRTCLRHRSMVHREALALYEDFKSAVPLRSDVNAWRSRWLLARRNGETVWGAALDATYGHPEIAGGSQ